MVRCANVIIGASVLARLFLCAVGTLACIAECNFLNQRACRVPVTRPCCLPRSAQRESGFESVPDSTGC